MDPLSTQLESPDSLSSDVPFAQTKDLLVNIPRNDIGKVDIYINDTIGIALDNQNNIQCISAVVPLAIHTIARPLDPLDTIPRKEIISLKKIS